METVKMNDIEILCLIGIIFNIMMGVLFNPFVFFISLSFAFIGLISSDIKLTNQKE